MKKNFKKLSSSALALVLASALSFSAFAADISAEKAKAAALKDAGYSESQVSQLSVRVDYDDGVKLYDVSFYVADGNGGYVEYDYDVKASDGRILEKDVEHERGRAPAQSKQSASGSAAAKSAQKVKQVGRQEALEAALAHFGLSPAEVKVYELHSDYDDGVAVYNVGLSKGYSEKYSCEVVVAGGAVRDAEREAVRGLEDKVELFFEVFLYWLFNSHS